MMNEKMDEGVDIDDSLYSRQRYVLGDKAMHKLAKANVLIIGLGGVGVEIAKNIILAGVKSVTFLDNKIAQASDLHSQFFLRQQDIDNKLPRSFACCKRLSELNPFVTVQCIEDDVRNNYELLRNYQCVLVSEMTFDEQIPLNNFCRSQSPVIPFISCDVIGVFSYLFCDFGPTFEVFDSDGEEPKEIFIRSLSKGNPCIITTLDNKRHGLVSNQIVQFKEINGMTKLNGQTHRITYISPFSFSIDCDTSSDEYEEHTHGGICIRVKEKVALHFDSLETQLNKPDILLHDLSKLDVPIQVLIGLISLQRYKCESDVQITDNINLYFNIAEDVNSKLHSNQNNSLCKNLLGTIAKTSDGILPPLCASIGGIASQEILKALSGKFTPLKQWLLIDVAELADTSNSPTNSTTPPHLLNRCLSSELITRLHSLKLFMVGCGAIGCELLKNFALLGIGTKDHGDNGDNGDNGLITITDNDLIEKSNLNRQFLFRPWHIQKSKSETAAQSALEINPALHIQALQHKVCPETQASIFNDAFFTKQDIVINALDNVEARRYVDGRCVSNQRALIETGTMGAKGHVQVIIPHLTETYSSQRDPLEEDVPYCTLKSFPQVIEHTIQWARDKFESLFTLKPSHYNKFWENTTGPLELAKVLCENEVPDGFVDAVRLLQNKPLNWKDCICLGRRKFESYFNHKANQLLTAFPPDTKLADGGMFWQSPKRPPTPLSFDTSNTLHMEFIVSYSRILARVNNIELTEEDIETRTIIKYLDEVVVPEFSPSNKKIETDETRMKKDIVSNENDDVGKISKLISYLKTQQQHKTVVMLNPEDFEKDNDSNGHIDFITSASNLRAMMYNIETVDRYKIKRIAGRIIPAIATTTATIAGLATLELLKTVAKQPLENYKNCFLNLALPMVVLSEPGVITSTKIGNGIEFSVWDRWDVYGHKDYKLKDFIDYFKKKFCLHVNMVCEGVRMIYVPIMPGHRKRVNDLMTKLLKPKKYDRYVDLVISFASGSISDDAEDLPAPPIRYFYESMN